MKLSYLFVVIGIFAGQGAMAADCSLDIFKTYTPRGGGRPACDEQNLPADFAGNLQDLIQGLKQRGYQASRYDQCSHGHDDPATYALISQLGDCVQHGTSMTCKLNVQVIENSSNQTIFENTIQATGNGAAELHLSDALQGLPNCNGR